MRISFDFDNTLYHPFGYGETGESNPQMIEIQFLLKKYIKDGDQVFIVTKRYGPENNKFGLGDEHLIVYEVAYNLGINPSNVYFTNREMKVNTLLNLGIERHFEDDKYECLLIAKNGIQVVPVLDPYWRDLIH
jgi:hypothetical protein